MTVSGLSAPTSSGISSASKLSINLRFQAMGFEEQPNDNARRDVVGTCRSWCDDIARLRSLPRSGIIVLFTPVLIPEGFTVTDENAERIDPFEKLGRELSRYHARICHVPYLTDVGLTEAHVDWIRHAAVIITVTCSRRAGTGRRGEYQAKLLAMQMQLFAHEVATAASEVRERSSKVPLIGIVFRENSNSFSDDYSTVLRMERYDYSRAALVARSLFTGGV